MNSKTPLPFRRQVDPDPLDTWKEKQEDAMRDDREAKDELLAKLCEAMGVLGKIGACGHPVKIALDANLIALAKEKLLTTDKLRGYFTRNLTTQCPEDHFWPRAWALTQPTVTQQAAAILEAPQK